MSKFVKGDRIGTYDGKKLHYGEYEDYAPYYGVITDELSDGRVMVRWDDKWRDNPARATKTDKLFHEQELRANYSALEIEFRRVEDEVKDKLMTASKLIIDAGKFAKQAGFSLAEMEAATSGLENAMESAGWNTSSWHC